ncbi:MAG: hypothetical protein ACREKN_06505 [Longimicrobiaceae bacterium]
MKDDRVREVAERVREAIRNEGLLPGYHRAVMEKHRLEWPVLWEVLDELLRVLDGEPEEESR